MDPDLKSLLEENLALAKQNNKMLRAMRRAGRWSALVRVLWWAFILISTYYFYQAYLEPLLGSIDGFHMPSQADIQQAMEQYQAR